MYLFDTHCHLDDPRLFEQLDEVLARADAAGVKKIASIGCARSLDGIRSALEIAHAHPDRVVATIGTHPHDAEHYDDAIEAEIRAIGEDPKIVAIGELGLDFYYDNSPREQQKEVMRRQIAIARELKLPIIVHTRSAAAETLEILREENARDVGGIIHCFSEDRDFAKEALELGFVASFSGIVTFKNAQAIQEAAIHQPLDALLVETDAPYLAPVPFRGKTNEPAYVAHTAAKIAELRGVDVEEILERSWENAHRVFALS